MRKASYLFILICFLQNIELVQSQEIKRNSSKSVSTFNMFREPSYLLFGSGIGNLEPLIFEGDLVPYYMVSINQNVKWGIQLSTRIMLRMYNKYSHPIRTPSFKPMLTFFYNLTDIEKENKDLFAFFSWFHYSNGQDGNFYQEDSTSINTLSGSFSTNWIEGGLFLSRPDPNFVYAVNYLKISVAYNYLQDNELNGIYGRLRFYSDFQSTLNLSKSFKFFNWSDNNQSVILNQTLRFGWIAGNLFDTNLIDKKRFVFRYTLSFKPSFLRDVTLFCQYYYGQDYYNIYFNRTLSVFRVGISSKIDFFNQ